jgi:hypothetical protein
MSGQLKKSGGEGSGGEGTGSGKGTPSGGKGSQSSGVPAGAASMLGLSDAPRVSGKGILTRIVKSGTGEEREFDLWRNVGKFDAAKLESILKLAQGESEYDLTDFIRAIEYQGFDRLFYIKSALSKMSVSMFCRFGVLGAVRGSNFSKIVESCEQMPEDMVAGFASLGFVKSPKKKDNLTILRCTASIPHWCAYYMLEAGVVKKIEMDCDAAIQFPGAASLPMSRSVRLKHLKFCTEFSSLLPGGTFNFNIYKTAMGNSIPVSSIPQSVLLVLGVGSNSESYQLTDEDSSPFTKQLVVRK